MSRLTPSWELGGSAGLARLLPADVPRAQLGPMVPEVPRAALMRLRNAGSASLAAALPSLHVACFIARGVQASEY